MFYLTTMMVAWQPKQKQEINIDTYTVAKICRKILGQDQAPKKLIFPSLCDTSLSSLMM